jgi:mannose-1-phosphate guanylyltransferase/mannose-1-phosphate guanylyltransferase/mannose-6-phosphate isomerase
MTAVSNEDQDSRAKGGRQIVRPVILCGGAGTRLWPVSRPSFPKQFLPLMGDQSLLQQTATRLSGSRFAPALLVSGEEQRVLIKDQLEQAGAAVEAIILEPAGRNTAAAATLAAAWLHQKGRDEVLLLMPSDHVIGDREAFLKAIDIALPHAEQGAIVTFGAQPIEPNTQYGYIEAAGNAGFGDGAFPIARFHEKPDATQAAEYLRTGRFFWNAGIFLLKSSTLLDEMRQHLPASLEAIAHAVRQATTDGPFVCPLTDAFLGAENISIDHAIMEKTSRGVVVPAEMDWSDVGSWDAVWKLGAKDSAGNVIQGEVVALDTRNSLLRNDGGPLVAAIGLENMAVIAVGDAVLVAPLDRMSDLKALVEKLRSDSSG